MSFMFENLDVYQKAVNFCERVITLTESFPKGYYFLSDQFNRASLSISLNIAEGNGRFTKADRKNFFVIARGSVQECVPILELLRRKSLLSDKLYDELRILIEEIAKMLSGLIKGIENRKY